MKRLPIPKLTAEKVSACNHLIGRRRNLSLRIGDEDFDLRFTAAPAADRRPAQTLRVDVGRFPAWIGLSRIGEFPPLADLLGGSSLSDLPPEVQTAVLAALLEPALDRLADACGEEVMISQVGAPDGPDDAALHVGFSLTCDDCPAVHGNIAFPTELLPTIIALADRATAMPYNDLSDVPITAAVEVGAASLPARQLQTLAPFDVILMDTTTLLEDDEPIARLALPPAIVYRARLEETGLTVEEIEPWAPRGPSEDDSAVAPEAAPVELTFDVGRLQMTLGEWAALGPGASVPLARCNEQSLCVRAAGRAVGRAEAVRIGGRAGARLLS